MKDISVQLRKSDTYTFPTINDVDPEDTSNSITVIKEKDSLTSSLPFFIIRSGNTLNINPSSMADVKNYTIIVEISDSKDTT